MILYSFFAFIGFSAFIALFNWRMGLYFFIVVGLVQDPVRKLIPGVPGYLVLATVPVWFAILVKLFTSRPHILRPLKQQYPSLNKSIFLLLLSMIPAAILSATYGPGSWQLTLVGAFSYGTILLGLIVGFWYAHNVKMLRNLLGFYCVVAASMQIGTYLEYSGYSLPTLGTAMFNAEWIRYIPGEIIHMVSGFFRSPDVMGWHAVMLAMTAITLAVSGRGWKRWLWVILAVWGCGLSVLCGRRKMIYMLPIFFVVMTWLHWFIRGRMKKISLAIVLFLSLSGGVYFYKYMSPHEAYMTYYTENPNQAVERFEKDGFDALLVTYQQNGFWGAGLGSATQGTHHLKVARPRTWQEGGVSRIMVELGVPGLFCFIYFGYALITTGWRLVTKRIDPNNKNFTIWAGLFTMMLTNAGSFVVSGQIFGDPFISCFFAFMIGALLSAVRLDEAMLIRPQRFSNSRQIKPQKLPQGNVDGKSFAG